VTDGLASALIISRRRALSDGLAALLDAMPQVGAVETAESLGEALGPSAPERNPAVILLDAGAAGADLGLAIRRAKAGWHAGRCIVLAQHVGQRNEAEAAGADSVLISGLPPDRLVATLARLLSQTDDGTRGCGSSAATGV
jgi:DNA-binding NarL/FixJ family response regulator